MSWGWGEVYDYDYEDTPEYMKQKIIEDMIIEGMREER